jgi:geranylgeranyl reductase family protein
MTYDVIVAGAGPAGASAAYWLGQAGRRVAVLEKEELPRYKPCGGGVPRAVFDRFPFDFSTIVERWIQQVRFRFRDRREIVADLPERSIAMVMRDRFDLHLLDHAQADVMDQAPVTAIEQDESGVTVTIASGETLRARYLFGADGANSRVSRLVGLRHDRQMGVAIEAEVPVDEDVLDEYVHTALFVFGALSKGYLWIFPKAEHLSVGIGTFQERVTNIKDTLRGKIAELGIEIDGTRLRSHPLPIHLRRELLRRGRVLLLGDAAGLMDPLLGEGIRHAVDSGRLAAESILNDSPQSYSRRVHREIGRDLLWGRRWAQLFYKYPRGSFELAVRNPLFVRDFLRLFAGEISYRRMAVHAIPNVLLGLSKRLPVKHRTDAEPIA